MAVSDFGVLMGRMTYKIFNRATEIPMETQAKVLEKLMKKNKDTEYGKKYHFDEIHSLKDYQEKVPLTTYEDYDSYVDRMINNGEKNLITSSRVQRWASSSGSVGKPKLMPKTGKDMLLMQGTGFCAVLGLVWQHYHDRGQKLGALRGPLVLVLTGKKTADGKDSNGVAQMPLSYIKPLFPFFSTSPIELLYPEHEEDFDITYLQLRFALPDRRVSFIGAGVITLMTSMFECLEDDWEMLCDDIENGTINSSIRMPDEFRQKFEKKFKPDKKRADELREEFKKGFENPIAPRIWPKLKFVYGMTGSNLSVYADKLKRWTGSTPMHKVGLGAAEGFMAMPVKMDADDYCLLPKSLIYEFLPVDAPDGTRPLLMNEIEEGKEYEIILTNHSGLYRYRMFDVVKVTGKYKKTPMVQLMYRLNLGMNVTNEKTTTQMLDAVAKQFEQQTGIELEGHSFYGDTDKPVPNYIFLFEPKGDVDMSKIGEYEDLLDDLLRRVNEKIEKYRNWNILGKPQIKVLKKDSYFDYREMLRQRGVVLNQIKPVTIINNEERKSFFFSHTL